MENDLPESLIYSEWIFESADFCEANGRFSDNRRERRESRKIRMRLINYLTISGDLVTSVAFDGPTGFEVYDAAGLLLSLDPSKPVFAICAGTLNSWPRCNVNSGDVVRFLTEHKHRIQQLENVPDPNDLAAVRDLALMSHDEGNRFQIGVRVLFLSRRKLIARQAENHCRASVVQTLRGRIGEAGSGVELGRAGLEPATERL